MSDPSAPPPRPPGKTVTVALAQRRRLLGGRRGDDRLTLTPEEIVVEHGALRAPLRFAPGSVVVASVDQGPAEVGRDAAGRFPILRRVGPSRVIPRSEGIEGWLWTSVDGSAFTMLGDDAPNLAFVLSPPLSGERLEAAFEPVMLADLAKRSPLGQPALFGLLLRVERLAEIEPALARYNLAGPVTDREVPPTQRRHLPGDKPANPAVEATRTSRSGSIPPPGTS